MWGGSMRVNVSTDYALRLVMELGRAAPSRLTARELHARQGLSEKLVQHALTALVAAGIVDSRRGTHGGSTLARSPADITVAQVIAATYAPVLLVAKRAPHGTSYPGAAAGLAHYWRSLEQDLEAILSATTLEQLLSL